MAGTATIASMAKNQSCPASVPSPSVWTIPATQASAVRRCSRRQRLAPMMWRA
jgi:hypothetical protein